MANCESDKLKKDDDRKISGSEQKNDQNNIDPYAWLEEIEGAVALDWVKSENKKTLAILTSSPNFQTIYQTNLQILNADDKIPYPEVRGPYVYNFWQDKVNVRGLWRRTSKADYESSEPKWDILLDVDELARKENENWVFKGVECLKPYKTCLVKLSRGGKDAVEVREFNLEDKSFLSQGFLLAEAKSHISWIDQNRVFVGTDFGDDSMTDSGYPRLVKIWHRGQSISEAKLLFAGEKQDVSVGGFTVEDDNKFYHFIERHLDFYNRHLYYMNNNEELKRLPLPDDAYFYGLLNGIAIIEPKSDWTIGNRIYRKGLLVSVPFSEWQDAKFDNLKVVFETDAMSAIANVEFSAHALIVNVTENVQSQIYRMSYDPNQASWVSQKISLPGLGSAFIRNDGKDSDSFWISFESFLIPATLFRVDDRNFALKAVKNRQAVFDSNLYESHQKWAVSKDGTRIPYFLVHKKGLVRDGLSPTLMYGYGGFRVSMDPFYLATWGHSWLSEGGVFVLANIRGGGEFGPGWHEAAIKENKMRSYEDFIAVAQALHVEQITSPKHLGIMGGSNGGLLVGAVMVLRPELFGAVVCQVPLLDMRKYHKLLAGASWMAEYGNPDDPNMWEVIKKYSPYHNVKADVTYPSVFFRTSTKDDRVHPAHARKMAHKMLDFGHNVLYYENIEGGHAGSSNNEQIAFAKALEMVFLQQRLK